MTNRINLAFGCYITSDIRKPVTIVSGKNADGVYIGDEKMTRLIVEDFGINPQPISQSNQVCSIGFSEKHNKWFGWSHRAISGFTIGSTVSIGDCAYRAPDKQSFGKQMTDFFCGEEYYEDADFYEHTDKITGKSGVMIVAKYNQSVPNTKLQGTVYQNFWPYPNEFGKGEWTAQSMEDAKQMAIDFANGVS